MGLLRVCSSCSRHVRSAEPSCPFCEARLRPLALAAVALGVMLGACERGGDVYGAPPPRTGPPDARADSVRGDAGAQTTPVPSNDPNRGGDVYGGPPPRPPVERDGDAGSRAIPDAPDAKPR